MKKVRRILSIMLILILCAGIFTGCGGGDSSGDSGNPLAGKGISVISREDGSGTRDAFVEITGVLEKDASGEKIDRTTVAAEITNSTAVMLSTVAGNKAAIGYISMGSMDSSVKALSISGIAPTAASVKSGNYELARPFNIVTKDNISEAAKDFINFIYSAYGQVIVENTGYVPVDTTDDFQASDITGKVVVAGSSSVTPLMTKLAEAYMSENPGVVVEVEQSDSTTGVTSVVEGICDIGMISRSLKDKEKSQSLSESTIAMDGIAVIVNNENPVSDLTLDIINAVYTGEITSWDDIIS